MTRFQRVNATVVSRDPEATTSIASPPKRGTIHCKDRRLAARRTAWCVVYAVRVCGDSPYWIRALEREKSLRDVGLDERYPARFPYKFDELDIVKTSDPSC